MTPGLTHDEAQSALGAAALDALSDVEQRAVLDHVATCEVCSADLAALRQTAAALADAAPASTHDVQRDRALRDRLIARATADASSRGISAPARQTPQHRTTGDTRLRWLAIAASVAFVAAGAALVRSDLQQRSLRSALTSLSGDRDQTRGRVDSLLAALAADERLLNGLTGPDVRVVELASTGRQPPSARMFWDRATNRWTFFVNRLAPAKTGRTYQLWLVTANAKISAGTFTTDSSGRAVVRAEYPLARDALQAVAVTEEPAGGMPQPTGSVILAGAASR